MQNAVRVALALVLALAVGAAALTAAAERTQTASGSVKRVDAEQRTVMVALSDDEETPFLWDKDTKINGTLTPGARVTVRYSVQPDGRNLAHQISVARS
jgi:Flp pilus assembly protein TadG